MSEKISVLAYDLEETDVILCEDGEYRKPYCIWKGSNCVSVAFEYVDGMVLNLYDEVQIIRE